MRTIRNLDNLAVIHDRVVVLVPAHNEAKDLAETICSLRNLHRIPDEIVVISDNSTDTTVEIARSMNVTVLETVDNSFKKAGALNTGFRYCIKDGTIPEFIVTMDGDTIFDANFLTYGLHAMHASPKAGVLSAICHGKQGLVPLPAWPPHLAAHRTLRYNLIQILLKYVMLLIPTLLSKSIVWLQSVEYARAGTLRLRQNIHTMSGAGSIIRGEAIIDLLEQHALAGRQTIALYDERADNLVEDFVLTLDLKKLGWQCINNAHAIAYTDLMRTLPALLRQRTRWGRGTYDELRRRKFSREVRLSSFSTILILLTMPLLYVWLGSMVEDVVNGRVVSLQFWLWYLIGLGIYQALMTLKKGWGAMLLSFTLLPDIVYSIIRHYWTISSLIMSVRTTQQEWE